MSSSTNDDVAIKNEPSAILLLNCLAFEIKRNCEKCSISFSAFLKDLINRSICRN